MTLAKPRYHARCLLKAMALSATLLLIACSNHAGMDGPAPQVSFKTIKNANPLSIDKLGKPLLVSFWSTSCVVCLKEMPHLAKIYEEFRPKGFEMVAVAMPFDRPSDVVQLSEQFEWPFLVALDLDEEVSKSFGDIRVTPTAFLIDQHGEFVQKYVGAIDLPKFRKTLQKLTLENG